MKLLPGSTLGDFQVEEEEHACKAAPHESACGADQELLPCHGLKQLLTLTV